MYIATDSAKRNKCTKVWLTAHPDPWWTTTAARSYTLFVSPPPPPPPPLLPPATVNWPMSSPLRGKPMGTLSFVLTHDVNLNLFRCIHSTWRRDVRGELWIVNLHAQVCLHRSELLVGVSPHSGWLGTFETEFGSLADTLIENCQFKHAGQHFYHLCSKRACMGMRLVFKKGLHGDEAKTQSLQNDLEDTPQRNCLPHYTPIPSIAPSRPLANNSQTVYVYTHRQTDCHYTSYGHKDRHKAHTHTLVNRRPVVTYSTAIVVGISDMG